MSKGEKLAANDCMSSTSSDDDSVKGLRKRFLSDESKKDGRKTLL